MRTCTQNQLKREDGKPWQQTEWAKRSVFDFIHKQTLGKRDCYKRLDNIASISFCAFGEQERVKIVEADEGTKG